MWIIRKSYETVSYLCTILVAYELGRWMYECFYILYGRSFKDPPDFRSFGQWVVITGATEKMGEAFVEYFGERGLDMFLIGHPMDQLEKIAELARMVYKIKVIVLPVDFRSEYNRDIYNLLDATLKHLDVGVLVNAVTEETTCPEWFMNVPYEDIIFQGWHNHNLSSRMILANILPVTYFCKIILPGMAKKKKGVIINISSINSILPSPYFTFNAASNAYVNKFTEGLYDEYSEDGIIFLCLTPGHVSNSTNNYSENRSFSLSPDAKTYVNDALCNLGVKEQSCGYITHSIMFYCFKAIDCVSSRLSRRGLRNLTRIYGDGGYLQFKKE